MLKVSRWRVCYSGLGSARGLLVTVRIVNRYIESLLNVGIGAVAVARVIRLRFSDPLLSRQDSVPGIFC
jgi:hypothetical protein